MLLPHRHGLYTKIVWQEQSPTVVMETEKIIIYNF